MLRCGGSPRLGPQRVLQLFERRGGVARGLRRALQLLPEQAAGHHPQQAVRVRCQETHLCEYHVGICVVSLLIVPFK